MLVIEICFYDSLRSHGDCAFVVPTISVQHYYIGMASKLNQCYSCKQIIEYTDTLVCCEGKCRRSAHPKCVNLDHDAVRLLKGSNGLSWRCEECRTTPLCNYEDNLKALDNKWEGNFRSICKKLEDVNKSLAFKPRRLRSIAMNETPTSRRNNEVSNPAKRKYISSPEEEDIVSRPNILVCDGVGTSSLAVASPPPPRNLMKFLFVSNMHRSVQTDATLKHVSDGLKIESSQVECFKLVKRDVDILGFRFISFKVGVAPELFDQINNIHFWPAGTKIKEFINHRPKNRIHQVARMPPVQPLRSPRYHQALMEEFVTPASSGMIG